QELAAQGIGPLDERLQELKQRFDDLSRIQDIREAFHGTFTEIGQDILQTLRTTQSAADTFRNILTSSLNHFADRLIKLALKPLDEELDKLIEKIGSQGLGNVVAGIFP